MLNQIFADSLEGKRVYVSDVDGTLIKVGAANFNDALFDFLIEAKQAGHAVFIASAAEGGSTGMLLKLQLKKRGLPETFFNIDHPEVDPAQMPILDKAALADILKDLGHSKVDYVFENESVNYLRDIPYGAHIDPRIFVEDSNQVSVFKLQALAARP